MNSLRPMPLSSRFFLRPLGCLLLGLTLLAPRAWAQLDLSRPGGASAPSAIVQTEQVRAELMAFAPDGVRAGAQLWLGLQIKHQPHWHTYWTNPGDSGLPTTLQWQLPPGMQAGEIVWPTPKRVAIGTMANFGYEDSVLLPVPVTVKPDFAPSVGARTATITLNASWLVCRQECIPQDGTFTLQLPLQGTSVLNAADFAAARAGSPQPLQGIAQAQLDAQGLALTVKGLPAAWRGQALNAFPEETAIVDGAAAPWSGMGKAHASMAQSWQGEVWQAHMPLSELRSSSPSELHWVLTLERQGIQATSAVQGDWPPAPSAAPTGAPLFPQTSVPVSKLPPSFLLALLGALLGGMVLNLMPCVFPVLAIKVLSFAAHAEHSRRSQRLQGLAYTAGVVLSFVALGGLLLALRSGGEQLGWGFQLQSPAVVVALALLFSLLGLNLLGLFEVGMLLPSRLASLQLRHPLADAALSGVLAVAIASPCTAPFMGASLGLAISLPAAQALLIFASLGLGLALPYLAASWTPLIARWMPRPGAWMETFKHFMAFPMALTVLWLVWVLGHIGGVDAAAALLALILAMAFCVWSLRLTGRMRAVFTIISIAVGLGTTLGLGPILLQTDGGVTEAAAAPGATWQPWVPGKVDAELAGGKPVFVDFTAAWCITCQYNKKTTLARPDVMADFQASGATLLRADWTRRDPAIAGALQALGRSGVPVYALYRPGAPPVVLSEILSAEELHAALAPLLPGKH